MFPTLSTSHNQSLISAPIGSGIRPPERSAISDLKNTLIISGEYSEVSRFGYVVLNWP